MKSVARKELEKRIARNRTPMNLWLMAATLQLPAIGYVFIKPSGWPIINCFIMGVALTSAWLRWRELRKVNAELRGLIEEERLHQHRMMHLVLASGRHVSVKVCGTVAIMCFKGPELSRKERQEVQDHAWNQLGRLN